MKLQGLTIIFIIIILPVVIVLSSYIGYELKTISKQNVYNTGVVKATHDAVFSFELNTKNDSYSNNAENKRTNIKAAVKTFENSLSTTCNLGLYNNEAIEEYIPAMVFGLYDGFYMYAPSELTQNGNPTYKHNLRNYVYYSEQILGTDIVIRYTLDNYVAVSGTFERESTGKDEYQTMAGYLIAGKWDETNKKYIINSEEIEIDEENISYQILNKDTQSFDTIPENSTAAINYYKSAFDFTQKFNNIISRTSLTDTLTIDVGNDPEDENSKFVQHKREIIKNKIAGVLNSSITAYSKRTSNTYKMPKLPEEDWEKIYNNISVIAFVQGMDLGFKNYNYYCVLNSTNSSEYVNPDLMYYIDKDNNYHDIRCSLLEDYQDSLIGYSITDFEPIKYTVNPGTASEDAKYYFKHDDMTDSNKDNWKYKYACYECINGGKRASNQSVYEYIKNASNNDLKKAYYTAIARERYNTTKLLANYNN